MPRQKTTKVIDAAFPGSFPPWPKTRRALRRGDNHARAYQKRVDGCLNYPSACQLKRLAGQRWPTTAVSGAALCLEALRIFAFCKEPPTDPAEHLVAWALRNGYRAAVRERKQLRPWAAALAAQAKSLASLPLHLTPAFPDAIPSVRRISVNELVRIQPHISESFYEAMRQWHFACCFLSAAKQWGSRRRGFYRAPIAASAMEQWSLNGESYAALRTAFESSDLIRLHKNEAKGRCRTYDIRVHTKRDDLETLTVREATLFGLLILHPHRPYDPHGLGRTPGGDGDDPDGDIIDRLNRFAQEDAIQQHGRCGHSGAGLEDGDIFKILGVDD